MYAVGNSQLAATTLGCGGTFANAGGVGSASESVGMAGNDMYVVCTLKGGLMPRRVKLFVWLGL